MSAPGQNQDLEDSCEKLLPKQHSRGTTRRMGDGFTGDGMPQLVNFVEIERESTRQHSRGTRRWTGNGLSKTTCNKRRLKNVSTGMRLLPGQHLRERDKFALITYRTVMNPSTRTRCSFHFNISGKFLPSFRAFHLGDDVARN